MKKYIVIVYYTLLRKVKNVLFNLRFSKTESSIEEKFGFIYKNAYWGKNKSQKFYSGIGSHKEEIIQPYIAAATDFLKSKVNKLSVVDLGCGDFNIGSKISPFAEKYIACDIVNELIEYNKTAFADLKNVSFRKVNIIDDELPDGDVCFIREVFQHLDNKSIQKAINKLVKYKYLVFTEHVPYSPFVPNKDHTAGFDTRLSNNSGVHLSEKPFDFNFRNETLICRVDVGNGTVDTYSYELSN